MRKRELDPGTARELAELEAMLRDDIRAQRPRVDPAIAQRLDAKAERGFREEAAPRAAVRRRLLPALTAASVLVIGGGVVVGQLAEDDPGQEPATQRTPAGDLREAPPAPGDAATGTPQDRLLVPESGSRLGRSDRRVERSATLELAAPADEVGQVADRVVDVADRHRAIVMSSIVTERGDSERASFELRVPVGRTRALLADLSDLGEVRARTASGRDVTGEFATAQDRLSDLRAERRSVLRRLAGADAPAERAMLRERLRQLRSQIAMARGELRSVRERTAFATVAVSIAPDPGSSGPDEGGLGGAIDRAGNVLEDIAGAALVGLAAISPLLLLALLGYGIARWRRRSREQALRP